jgi:hypothetical protein
VLRKNIFVWDVDKFILEHQVFLYKLHVKCNSARKSQGKFRRKFPRVQVPHRDAIQNLVSKVRTDMLMDRKPKHQC